MHFFNTRSVLYLQYTLWYTRKNITNNSSKNVRFYIFLINSKLGVFKDPATLVKEKQILNNFFHKQILTFWVALGCKLETIQIDGIPPEQSGQELIVQYMLVASHHNAAGSLVQSLIAPMGINCMEAVDQAVVFPHVDGMQGCECCLLTGSPIT